MMELDEDTVKNLINTDNLNALTDQVFKELLELGVSQNYGKFDFDAFSEVHRVKADNVGAAYVDIAKLIFEAARHNTDAEQLKELLNTTTLSESRINDLSLAYSNHKECLQESLEAVGTDFPHIVDVDWRLDYCIKSSTSNDVGTAYYHICLSTTKQGEIEKFTFVCTIQQLHDLVYKLKDAARHVEKLANPS